MSAKIDELLDIMRRLRDPGGGCPWDLAQTSKSIAPSTLEEAFEVLDAIEASDAAHLCEELGDLLFQIVFHAQIASERGEFVFEDVVAGICGKLLRRHPHVFAGADRPSVEQQSRAWEDIKAGERAEARTSGEPVSHLHGVPLALPALIRAQKLSRRAARVGFDWERAEQTAAKVQEELDEVCAAMGGDVSELRSAALEEELGDLLFAVANLARKLDIDAESALRAANKKFERRFKSMEALSRERGVAFEHALLDEQEALWQEVKHREHPEP